jgi:L-iditol 2-dehydrogenase
VLVRIDAALAGGTDRKAFLRGHPQIPMPGPFGHRYSGTVAALGPDAPPFHIGEPVMGVHSAPCLACRFCRSGHENLCPDVMKDKVLGAFAQYLCIPAAVARQNLFPRPAALSAEHAALLEPLSCVVHGLKLLDWRGVDRILVLGLGVMGLLFTQLLPRYTKAERVAAGRRPPRLELARRFGAASVWDVGQTALSDPLHRAKCFDCVIECTGSLEGWQQAFDWTAPGGQVLLFGGLPRGTVFSPDTYRLHYEEIRVLGDFHFAPRDVAEAREHLLSGGLELAPLIDGRTSLEGLPEAFERLGHGEAMQYAVLPENEKLGFG